MSDHSQLNKLRTADPDTFVWVKGRVDMLVPPPTTEAVAQLVDETIWGLSQESGLGAAVARGLLQLMKPADTELRATYLRLVHEAARTGPTLGRILATFAAPVLRHDPGLVEPFRRTVAIMLEKGAYTLTAPLEVLAELVTAADRDAAHAYLDLLAATFEQSLSYNQSLRLVYLLPKAVRGFASRRREAQIRQLGGIVRTDLQLVEPLMDGLEKEAGLLDGPALARFVASALALYERTPEAGKKFLSLTSKVGQDACAALQRAVILARTQEPLNRYLQARVGRSVAVRPLSELPDPVSRESLVASDGRCIYLPDELDRFGARADNLQLYKALVRLEAGNLEWRSYDFDLDRAADRAPHLPHWGNIAAIDTDTVAICDGERFVNSFPNPPLAQDLFTLFEHARTMRLAKSRYPGLMQQVMPLVRREARGGSRAGGHLLNPIAARLLLDLPTPYATDGPAARIQPALVALYREQETDDAIVEDSARMVCQALDMMESHAGGTSHRYQPYPFPFGRRIRWDLVSRAADARDHLARRIKVRLDAQDLGVYQSDVKQLLAEQQGMLSRDDIVVLILRRNTDRPAGQVAADLSALDLDDLLQQAVTAMTPSNPEGGRVFSHPEWDHRLQDYLQGHTRVRERALPRDGGDEFYQNTLMQHRGLVTHMKRAFELLKPEGLALLRQWPEGDAFDYRALLDFAIDRRAGRIPSDRLFIKRLKQERDVAVTLLLDLSRSTANPVAGGHTTVLDLAKEAAVLFCEALEVVGDRYALAGFSGSGRHAVDFYGIKRFTEPLDEEVRIRLSGLRPQRSTRMGAAIRHAAGWLARTESRVRLLIVVSDGFPNDLGYKADYAIADTRRAVQEARARNYHVKAITVNIGSDPRLDDLYGRMHHHVIGDVRELPDKLLRLYGTLTRC